MLARFLVSYRFTRFKYMLANVILNWTATQTNMGLCFSLTGHVHKLIHCVITFIIETYIYKNVTT